MIPIAERHQAANDSRPPEFVVTIRKGHTELAYTRPFQSSDAAWIDAAALLKRRRIDGATVRIRPLVETTYMHGRARWPNQLHSEASEAAREGWRTARGAEVPTRVIRVVEARA